MELVRTGNNRPPVSVKANASWHVGNYSECLIGCSLVGMLSPGVGQHGYPVQLKVELTDHVDHQIGHERGPVGFV